MKHPYFWLRFRHTQEWVIFEQITTNRFYGWGAYWSASYFDRFTGPLLDPDNQSTIKVL